MFVNEGKMIKKWIYIIQFLLPFLYLSIKQGKKSV